MRFNWKQESGGEVWVWGSADNEKMTGPFRREGDSSGGGSRGKEGAHMQEGPWALRTRGRECRHADQRKRPGKGLRKGGEEGPGVVHPLAQTRRWVFNHTLLSVRSCVSK